MANKLKFDIAANDRTKKAFGTIKKGLGGITKALTSFKTAIVAAVGVAGIGLLVKSSLTAIDRIGKLSRQLFISTQDLGAFQLAADLGGTSLEAFAKGARTLAVGINDFLVKGTGVAKEAFEQLGITQQDLKATNGDLFAQFELTADALNKLEGSTDKTAIAYKLFGGRNIELLTAIEGGAAGLKEIRDQAERFGLTLSADMVKRVEDANDSMTRMSYRLKGLRDNFVVALAPTLERISEAMGKMFDNFVASNGGIEKFAELMVTKLLMAMRAIVQAIGNMVFFLEDTVSNIKEILSWMGLWSKTQEELTTDIEESQKQLDKWLKTGRDDPFALEVIEKYTNKIANAEEKLKRLQLQTQLTHGEGTTSAEVFLTIDSVLADLIVTMDEYNKELNTTNDLLGEQQDAHILLHNEYMENLKERENEEKRVYETMKFLSMKRYMEDKLAMEKKKQMQREFNSFMLDTSLSTFEKLGSLNAKAFRIYKALAIAKTIIATREAAVQAYARFGGWPFGAIAAAATIAEGMAQVSVIRSQQYSGRRYGGSVREGQPYMVGEAGRELFVPNSSGRIVSNDDLKQQNGMKAVNITFNIQANDTEGFDDLLSKRRGFIISMINQSLNQQGKESLV
jgi:hypothetical protein